MTTVLGGSASEAVLYISGPKSALCSFCGDAASPWERTHLSGCRIKFVCRKPLLDSLITKAMINEDMELPPFRKEVEDSAVEQNP